MRSGRCARSRHQHGQQRQHRQRKQQTAHLLHRPSRALLLGHHALQPMLDVPGVMLLPVHPPHGTGP